MALSLVNFVTGGQQASGNAITAPFSSTTGNLIVVGVRIAQNVSNISSVMDTALNTYTVIPGSSQSVGVTQATFLYFAKNITGNAANVITATLGAVLQPSQVFVHGKFQEQTKHLL